MTALFREIARRDRVLAVWGWVFLGLFVLTACAAGFDGRTVLGINPWVKPMKFMISTPIFLWTLAWLAGHLPRRGRAMSVIAWGTSLMMAGVVACVSLQSARGIPSSFNVSTPFNTAVYAMLGVTILITAALVGWFLVLYFREDVRLDRAYLWGIRLGIMVFILGSLQGVLMSWYAAHTVGAPDGGPGLPLVNWSTRAGDLRVAHMLGIHALQVIPFFGWLVSRRPVAWVAGFSALYAATAVLLVLQAVAGRPFLAL
jgi:hypothetical protein